MGLDSQKIIAAMVGACLNPKELAEKSGLSVATIHRICREKADVSTGTLGKLAKALDVPWRSLLADDEDFLN